MFTWPILKHYSLKHMSFQELHKNYIFCSDKPLTCILIIFLFICYRCSFVVQHFLFYFTLIFDLVSMNRMVSNHVAYNNKLFLLSIHLFWNHSNWNLKFLEQYNQEFHWADSDILLFCCRNQIIQSHKWLLAYKIKDVLAKYLRVLYLDAIFLYHEWKLDLVIFIS